MKGLFISLSGVAGFICLTILHSPGIVNAIDLAKERGSKIVGIIGKEEGFTRKIADASILVPIVNPNHITPHSESFQTVLWHLFASLPNLKINQTKWESVK